MRLIRDPPEAAGRRTCAGMEMRSPSSVLLETGKQSKTRFTPLFMHSSLTLLLVALLPFLSPLPQYVSSLYTVYTPAPSASFSPASFWICLYEQRLEHQEDLISGSICGRLIGQDVGWPVTERFRVQRWKRRASLQWMPECGWPALQRPHAAEVLLNKALHPNPYESAPRETMLKSFWIRDECGWITRASCLPQAPSPVANTYSLPDGSGRQIWPWIQTEKV